MKTVSGVNFEVARSFPHVTHDFTTFQCPKNQFRLKVNIKASAGDWVVQRRNEASAWPYRQCQEQRSSSDWMTVPPKTEACHRSALDFTSLSNYSVDVLWAGVS